MSSLRLCVAAVNCTSAELYCKTFGEFRYSHGHTPTTLQKNNIIDCKHYHTEPFPFEKIQAIFYVKSFILNFSWQKLFHTVILTAVHKIFVNNGRSTVYLWLYACSTVLVQCRRVLVQLMTLVHNLFGLCKHYRVAELLLQNVPAEIFC